MIKVFFFFIGHSSLPSSGRIDDSRAYGLTLLLQIEGAAFAQIQLVADEKAPIAHKASTDGTKVHMLRSLSNGSLPHGAQLLLIERSPEGLLCFRVRFLCRLGKPNRLIAEGRAATGACNAKQDHLPRG
jgi:hypothetical protein